MYYAYGSVRAILSYRVYQLYDIYLKNEGLSPTSPPPPHFFAYVQVVL